MDQDQGKSKQRQAINHKIKQNMDHVKEPSTLS